MSINSSKYYNVKVYTENDTYITTWDTDVVDGISFNNEINSAGGQMVLTLARNAGDYGEGSDVDFGHKVKVYCFDKEDPNGKLIFQGYISSYTPIYKDDRVEVTLLSYGSELNSYMIEAGDSLLIQQDSGNYPQGFGDWSNATYIRSVAQTLTMSGNGTISKIIVWIDGKKNQENLEIIANMYLGASVGSGTLMATSNPITITPNLIDDYQLVFEEPIDYTDGQQLYFTVDTVEQYSPTAGVYPVAMFMKTPSAYSGGVAYTLANGGSWTEKTGYDLTFELYISADNTEAEFLTYEPSSILRRIIHDYNNQGGILTYTSSSIDNTNTDVSYTFNVNTILEGIKKIGELAPKDWYWYLDYGTNLIHFHLKSEQPDHIFSLEKDIIDARFEKRIEDIVNVIYFTGGIPNGDTEALFIKYENTDSITKYGNRAIKYTDQRVTLTATADTIANAILESRSEPELRVTLEILDSNTGNDTGYDLESLQVGDLIAVRNMTQQVGLSTWGISRWDESYWDFNIYNLSSLQMQIQKIEYKGDMAIIQASTIPPDVNKRIEDINRNLEVIQTLNNPTAPI